jgi:hypothetical protein
METAPFRISMSARFDATPTVFAEARGSRRWVDWFPLMYRAE